MSRIVVNGISEELKARFKIACKTFDITMSELVLQKIIEFTNDTVEKQVNGSYKIFVPAFIEQEDGSFISNPILEKKK